MGSQVSCPQVCEGGQEPESCRQAAVGVGTCLWVVAASPADARSIHSCPLAGAFVNCVAAPFPVLESPFQPPPTLPLCHLLLRPLP